MTSDRNIVSMLCVVFFVAGLLFGAGSMGLVLHSKYRSEAIECGYAEHDAKTGAWRWKEHDNAK